MDTTMQTTRRNALKIGGVTVTLGALMSACGENVGGSEDPGRVGNAPTLPPLPDYEVDDAVLLRTASSLEYTAIAVYELVLGIDGVVPDDLIPFVERLIADHEEIASEMVELTTAAGGEPWECPNDWFMERLINPAVAAIQAPVVGTILGEDLGGRVRLAGEELDVDDDLVITARGEMSVIDDVEVSAGRITSINGVPAVEGAEVQFERIEGDIAADIFALANALESFAASSHQELTSAISRDNVDARVAHARAAALEARHAAAISITVDGAEGYVSPVVLGEDAAPAADGQLRQYAIPSVFGLTSPIEIKVGGPDVNGVRTSYVLQTPADNSFVYNELEPSCSA